MKKLTSLFVATFLLFIALPSIARTSDLQSKRDSELVNSINMPPECRRGISQFSELLEDYDVSSRRGRNATERENLPRAEQTFRKIKAAVHQTELRAPQCLGPTMLFELLWQSRLSVLPNSKEKFGLIEMLFNKGKIKAVTRSDRKRLGGEWLKASSRSKAQPKILGGYDCTTSTIYMDPYLAPQDLFALFSHEAAHLFRDKFVVPSDLGLTEREYVLADESLAAIQAGVEELSDYRAVPSQVDVSFYKEGGDLQDMFRHMQMPSTGEFVKKAFVNSEFSSQVAKIFGLVENVYFSRSDLRPAEIVSKLSKAPVSVLNATPELSIWGTWLPVNQKRRIDDSLAAPSRACHVLSQKSGDFQDYLGTKVTSPQNSRKKDKRKGVKPGSEGVKPGSEGVKPGSEGVKPGSEGVKPETVEVRPSTLLRPCVHLGNEL